MMNRKFYFSLLAFALAFTATVAFVVGSGTGRAGAASTASALSALPASDFVIGIDVQRGINETLPTMLATHPAVLARMNDKLGQFQRETGINLRTFESIAIGGRISGGKPQESRTVVIARGGFNADQLLETAFASARAKGDKFQKEEQQYEGKRVVLIRSTRGLKKEATAGADSAEVVPDIMSAKNSMAIAVLDSNTLALGELEGVRAAVDAGMGRERVDDELVRLATQRPGAIIGFSGRLPQNLTRKVSSGNVMERYFSSIRQFYGSFSANGTEAESVVVLRTETPQQASEIGHALNALKTFSSFGLGQSRGAGSTQADSLAEILKGFSVTVSSDEVQIDVKIPQASIAPLIRVF
jgi:hypothetical protein